MYHSTDNYNKLSFNIYYKHMYTHIYIYARAFANICTNIYAHTYVCTVGKEKKKLKHPY